MLSCVNQIRETTPKKKAQSSWKWACLQWPVDGEGRTAPRTVDLHSAAKQAQSATQPAPQSPGCDLVQGESSSSYTKLGNKGEISSFSGCRHEYMLSSITLVIVNGSVLSAGMVRGRACPAPRWPRRQWFLWSTARSPNYPWIVTCCSSSISSSATSSPSLSIMSTSTRRCGGTLCHTLPHTHL